MVTWLSAGSALGLLAGCASSSSDRDTAGNTPNTTMTAAYSSDSAGTTTQPLVDTTEGRARLAVTEIAYDQLPLAVQAAIQQQAHNQPIIKIKRETRKGQTVYKVELKAEQGALLHGTLIIAGDGSILKESRVSD